MGLRESFQRWKSIILNTKRARMRIHENQLNVQRLAIKGFSNLENKYLDFKTRISKQEAKVYSQNAEDGLLMFIMNEIGVENYSIVEIGIGDGKECNSRNLVENFGWNAWMIDGSALNVLEAEKFYANQIEEGTVVVHNSWVTKENIEETIKNLDVPVNIDILSIDIDGNDYWVWESIKSISSKVVIIEYNASFGPERSVTVPYDPEFDRFKKHNSGYYHGASLKALEKLGKEKGYSLICCDSKGVNAIFLKQDLINNTLLIEQEVKHAYYSIKKRMLKMSAKDQFDLIKKLPLTDV